MKIYLVGGAVRDQLLGIPMKEKDWVVVGADPEEMQHLGYKQVGKEFPVFLHPETKEEYALARREKKVAPGYAGFAFDTSPEVTLEEDLQRRDLTINAMAQTAEGELIDPYQGKADLDKKILKHVSPAFAEDPVRILRVARFAARFADRGFKLAPETNALMQGMVASKEVDALVAERVWKEWERALGEKSPDMFFYVLAECHALSVLFPMIRMDSEAITVLKSAAALTTNTVVRFAALLHHCSEEEITWLCQRYRVPVEYREMALLVARHYRQVLKFTELPAEEVLALFLATDAFRRQSRFQLFLLTCQAIADLHHPVFSSAGILSVFARVQQINVQEWVDQGCTGLEIAEKLKQGRLEILKQVCAKG